jgi:hypothetical protein
MVMYGLVFHMPEIFHIPADQTALSGTVVFNTFVLMQLVNQVILYKVYSQTPHPRWYRPLQYLRADAAGQLGKPQNLHQ